MRTKIQNNKTTYNKHSLTKGQVKYNIQKDNTIGSLLSSPYREMNMQLLHGYFTKPETLLAKWKL